MNDTKNLLCLTAILAVMFLGVLAIDNIPEVIVKHVPVQPGKIDPLPPSQKVKPLIPKPIPVKPKYEEFPRAGITNPRCLTYRRNDKGVMTVHRRLVNTYLNCVVFREYVYKSNRYYLIQVNQLGYVQDHHIVKEEGISVLGKL